jgi:DNA-binding transcriptional regulator YiaG
MRRGSATTRGDPPPVFSELIPQLERKIAETNATLGERRDVPDAVPEVVMDVSGILDDVPEQELYRYDPYLVLSLYRGTVDALRALGAENAGAKRRRMRIALEQMRQALRDLEEGLPIREDKSTTEIVNWLLETVDASQGDLARLLGTSRRTLQRWISESGAAEPRGAENRRVRIVARLVNHLRHALTGPGVIAWFERPHPELKGKPPIAILNDPDAPIRLNRLAAGVRSVGMT